MSGAGAAGEVRVRGLRELNQALAKADRDVRLGIRKELRDVADPVRVDAELLAVSDIRNIDEGDRWSKMRVGQTHSIVYVAPRQRGIKRNGRWRRRRPNLAPLLLERALMPALERNRDEVNERLDNMLGRVAGEFNRG